MRRGADDDEIARRNHIVKDAQPPSIVQLRHMQYRDGYFTPAPYLDTREYCRSMISLICQTGCLWRNRETQR